MCELSAILFMTYRGFKAESHAFPMLRNFALLALWGVVDGVSLGDVSNSKLQGRLIQHLTSDLLGEACGYAYAGEQVLHARQSLPPEAPKDIIQLT